MATWRRGFDVGDSVKRDSRDWDEHWNVLDYDPPVGQPPSELLLWERPDLAPGQPHPVILGAYVDEFSPEQIVKGGDAWDVTVRYVRGREEVDLSLPPTQRPAVIDATHESVEVPTFRKQNDDPWVNTAGDLIAGITRTENHWIFNVQKNVQTVPAWFLNYADAVNSDAVTIKGLAILPHYLMLKEPRIPLNPSTETIGGIAYSYYPISFSLVYNPRTWITKVYNRGLFEIDAVEGYRRIEIDGEPVDEPQFLDEDGAFLPPPVDPADMVILEGWDHELLPFSVLPLS
jgi:hypothetical protein